jgi:hypothetical protein
MRVLWKGGEMFEEQIAHGRNMIRRLESESRLSQTDRDSLPPHLRVPTREAKLWQEIIERKIQSEFRRDAFERYRIVWEVYSDELNRGQGDEYSCRINAFHRIVYFLEELDSRPTNSRGSS